MSQQRALVVWLYLFVAGFSNGMLREALLAPRMSAAAANQVSCFTAIGLFYLVLRAVTRRWPIKSKRAALRLGFEWLLLTVAFEFLFFHYAAGHAWTELLGAYRIWEGRLWPLVLLSLVVIPWTLAPARRDG